MLSSKNAHGITLAAALLIVLDKDPSILPVTYDVIGSSGSVKLGTDSPHFEPKISFFCHFQYPNSV